MKYLKHLLICLFILLCCYALSLIQNNPKKDKNDLFLAAKSGNIPMVDQLIKQHNCSPQDKDKFGMTALHWVAEVGKIPMVDHLIKQYNCSPQAKDNDGMTALHWAALGGNIAMVDHLITTYECSLKAKDNDGKTALHYAAEAGQIAMVDHLITTYKCSLNDKTNDGYTPLDLIYDQMKTTDSSITWQEYNTLWELVIEEHGGRCNQYANRHSDIPEKPKRPLVTKAMLLPILVVQLSQSSTEM